MRERVKRVSGTAHVVLLVGAGIAVLLGTDILLNAAFGEYMDGTVVSVDHESGSCSVSWALGGGSVSCRADSIDRGQTVRIFVGDVFGEGWVFTDGAEAWEVTAVWFVLAAGLVLLSLFLAWLGGELRWKPLGEAPGGTVWESSVHRVVGSASDRTAEVDGSGAPVPESLTVTLAGRSVIATLLAGLGLIGGIGAIWAGFVLATHEGLTEDKLGELWGWVGIGAPSAILLSWAAFRNLARGLRADASGVVVTNLFKTHNFAWPEVLAVEVTDGEDEGSPYQQIRLTTPKGGVSLDAKKARDAEGRDQLRSISADLNRMREQRTSGPAAPGRP